MTALGISGNLITLFNYSLKHAMFPKDWKSTNVSPVHKGGNSVEVSNFRPVSVLPVISKVFERLLYNQFYSYLQQHAILNPAQSRFRQKHTKQDVLVSIVDDWRKQLDENQLVGAVMLDLSKAFDMVDHRILLKKLFCYGVN